MSYPQVQDCLQVQEMFSAYLDGAALSSGGPVTIPLARKVLADPSCQPWSPRKDSAVT